MPYIAPDRRKRLDEHIEGLQKQLQELGGNEGDLNYVISRIIGAMFLNDTRYHTIARVIGVLSNVKDEFYRRLGIPYENEAREKNGDVPEFERIEAFIEGSRRERILGIVAR